MQWSNLGEQLQDRIAFQVLLQYQELPSGHGPKVMKMIKGITYQPHLKWARAAKALEVGGMSGLGIWIRDTYSNYMGMAHLFR